MSGADTDAHGDRPAPTAVRRPHWVTVFVAVTALVVAALLGAAGGLLLAGSARQEAAPSPVDVGFAQDMSAHHRQGVEMARIARQRTSDPEIRQLAFDIASTQTEQMGRMRGWLALWSQPLRPVGQRMSWMRGEHGSGGHHAMHEGRMMPGMATSAELDRLRSLSGTQLDTYFLQLMLRHHQGGAPMMRQAVQRAKVPAVRNLAQQMWRAQTAEAATMTRMLAERGATPLPSP